MNLDKIQEMWEVDSVINEFELDAESLRIPQLHQKYYKLYTEFKFILKENEFKVKTREVGISLLLKSSSGFFLSQAISQWYGD